MGPNGPLLALLGTPQPFSSLLWVIWGYRKQGRAVTHPTSSTLVCTRSQEISLQVDYLRAVFYSGIVPKGLLGFACGVLTQTSSRRGLYYVADMLDPIMERYLAYGCLLVVGTAWKLSYGLHNTSALKVEGAQIWSK